MIIKYLHFNIIHQMFFVISALLVRLCLIIILTVHLWPLAAPLFYLKFLLNMWKLSVHTLHLHIETESHREHIRDFGDFLIYQSLYQNAWIYCFLSSVVTLAFSLVKRADGTRFLWLQVVVVYCHSTTSHNFYSARCPSSCLAFSVHTSGRVSRSLWHYLIWKVLKPWSLKQLKYFKTLDY